MSKDRFSELERLSMEIWMEGDNELSLSVDRTRKEIERQFRREPSATVVLPEKHRARLEELIVAAGMHFETSAEGKTRVTFDGTQAPAPVAPVEKPKPQAKAKPPAAQPPPAPPSPGAIDPPKNVVRKKKT